MSDAFFDLHCDTLTVCCEKRLPLCNDVTELRLGQASCFACYTQVFAIFISDELRGRAAVDYFCKNIAYFRAQCGSCAG
jgi:membrane dipeptidase